MISRICVFEKISKKTFFFFLVSKRVGRCKCVKLLANSGKSHSMTSRNHFCLPLQIFNGNNGRYETVKHNLVGITRARFIQFQPTAFSTRKALRVEVYGVLKPAGNSLTLA